MNPWRLIDSGALPSALNMGIDRALLQLYARGESPPTLRFYQWNPPGVSLGRLQQRPGFDADVCQRLGFDVVRRPTGGRAVLHQNDLTYSIITGTQEGIPITLPAAYHLLCRGLLAGFRLLGIEAELGQEQARADQPDVCFLRSLIGDIVFRGKKFVGSAQAWSGSSLLQHGSILLEPQTAAWSELLGGDEETKLARCEDLRKRMTSLTEILGYSPEIQSVKEAIVKGMSQVLEVAFADSHLTASEWELSRKLADQMKEATESHF